MPRPLFDSEYIFGIHEPGGEGNMLELGRSGWIVFTEGIGCDPNDTSSSDYRSYSDRGLGVIVRLNNGYAPGGTIPNDGRYADFARRCANFVANSQGCKLWIIGNEMNFAIERPPRLGPSAAPIAPIAAPQMGPPPPPAARKQLNWAQKLLHALSQGMGDAQLFGDIQAAAPPPAPAGQAASARTHADRFSALSASSTPIQPAPPMQGPTPAGAPMPAMAPQSDGEGEVITPERYVRCYTLVRNAIHAVAGHGDDQVLIGAVAPWNDQTRYNGNELGDWIAYFRDILTLLGPNGCDGITLHTYTHGDDPGLVFDEGKMDAPFQNRHYHFRTYRDFMAAIPDSMRHLPVYITETDQDVEWRNANSGWIRNAYGEIDWWNKQPGNQQIRALILYRWPNKDKWVIEGKSAVIDDFRSALGNDYRWKATLPSPLLFAANDKARTVTIVNLRRSPGALNKPAQDIVALLPQGSELTIRDAVAQKLEGLLWWNVTAKGADGQPVSGWLAQYSSAGAALIEKAPPPAAPPSFKPNDPVLTLDAVRVRRTPGYSNKPTNDILVTLSAGARLTILEGPVTADSLAWWRISGVDESGQPLQGWVAESAPGGARLLEKPAISVSPAGAPATPATAPAFAAGDSVQTQDFVRMRATPGIQNKPPQDIVTDLPPQVTGKILAGPQFVDALTWWQVEARDASNTVRRGWCAEVSPTGVTLLLKVAGGAPTAPSPLYKRNDLLTTLQPVNVRRSPGFLGKSADDVVTQLSVRATVNILEGPHLVDGLTWWRVGGISQTAGEVIGWVAEKLADGAALIAHPAMLPGTTIPDQATGAFLRLPFVGQFGIAQLWGENPQIYGRFGYDGVPLAGHNGIDFLTPIGTPLVAVHDGVVAEAVFNDPTGFGNYIKLQHVWGESLYAHLDSIGVVAGQSVAGGAVIGQSGNTGFSGGPHLHFSIRVAPYVRGDGWGGFSDPLPYMNSAEIQLPSYVLAPPSGVAAAAATSAPRQRRAAVGTGMAPDDPAVPRP